MPLMMRPFKSGVWQRATFSECGVRAQPRKEKVYKAGAKWQREKRTGLRYPDVCTRADQEEQHHQKALEVEDRRLQREVVEG